MAIYLRTYGAGWFTLLFRGSFPGKRGQQKLFGIPTFRGPSAKMSTFHLPLRGSQSNHFIFQMKKPDTDSGPLFPILLHSKAETRYVHGMGAAVGGFMLIRSSQTQFTESGEKRKPTARSTSPPSAVKLKVTNGSHGFTFRHKAPARGKLRFESEDSEVGRRNIGT